MKKAALRLIILIALFKVALCVLFGRNFYFHYRTTWSEAREYCREHHTDLCSISNQEEDQNILYIRGAYWFLKVWIGLYRDDNDTDTWKWSGGNNASFFNWSENNGTGGRCVVQGYKGWQKKDCEETYHFCCFQSSLVLVKENKTWEQALRHCRDQHTDLISESALIETLQTSREAQTDHVWTGLRYLAGIWLWVNEDNMEYQVWSHGKLPQCPARNRHCGALSLEGQDWESWDCADKLYFVCY